MKLRRTRLRLALTIAAAIALLAIIPLLMWRGERVGAIDDEFDLWLVEQMEDIQRTWIAGEPTPDIDAWQVNDVEEWSNPLADGITIEPPLLTWMRDTGNSPSFRDFAVDETSFRAYVLPITEDEGFVTLLDTAERDEQRSDIDRRTMILALGALVIGAAAGWLIAGMAVGPMRQAMTDQQGFLADAAHEMRTPLAVILASSSQALSRPRSEEEYVRSLSEIRSAAERAGSGVNELLELIRFESGQAIPRLAPVRLDLLAEEVAASVRSDGCEVVAEPTAPVVVQADMPLLRQALDNVVRNAVRRSTHVELQTHRNGRDGMVTVTDNGPGFDAAVIDSVFDRYQRGDRKGEVGIGLAIVKAIVGAHGGSVNATNRTGYADDDSTGAIVELRVPLDQSV